MTGPLFGKKGDRRLLVSLFILEFSDGHSCLRIIEGVARGFKGLRSHLLCSLILRFQASYLEPIPEEDFMS